MLENNKIMKKCFNQNRENGKILRKLKSSNRGKCENPEKVRKVRKVVKMPCI